MQRQYVRASDAAIEALWRGGEGPAALLHAGRFHPRWARRSLLGRPVAWYRYSDGAGGGLDRPRGDGRAGSPGIDWPEVGGGRSAWEDLRALLAATSGRGRWVGFFSYDLAYRLEPGKLGARHRAAGGTAAGDWPLIELGYCPTMESHAPPVEAVDGAVELAPPPEPAIGTGALEGGAVRPAVDRPTHEASIQRVIDYIAAGDVFQVNLAHPFIGSIRCDPRSLYQRLATISPAWYGAYLELGGGGGGMPERALLSTSPELFLEVRGRDVVTRPIKGTRPAGERRAEARRALLESEKDAAELHMIVDLLRNDLGRVCDYGSVRVLESRAIETHPTVHHGVSTVAGRLHESKDIVDLLRATLPGGSITGAPKVRAMQIIDALEPWPRGPYCGAIGWITADAACLNVAIRTMVLGRRHGGPHEGAAVGRGPVDDARGARYDVSFHVGGGVVADSDPASEYDETLDKARAMLRALGRDEASAPAPGVTRP